MRKRMPEKWCPVWISPAAHELLKQHCAKEPERRQRWVLSALLVKELTKGTDERACLAESLQVLGRQDSRTVSLTIDARKKRGKGGGTG